MTDQFLPVKINIKDNQRFIQVALILDNALVVKHLLIFRRKWRIGGFYRSVEYIEWVKKLGIKDSNFNKEIIALRQKLNLDPIFDKVLKMAIVCNEVRDVDYKTAYLEPVFIPNRGITYDTRYAIYITPDTSKYEVLETFIKFKKEIIISRDLKKSKKYLYEWKRLTTKVFVTDTKPEIKRDREWYWLHREGKSYLQIAKETLYRGKIAPIDFVDNVKKQIGRYEKLLKKVTFNRDQSSPSISTS